MTTKFEAIKAINPNIILSQNGDEFTIHNSEEMPSDVKIKAKQAELQTDYDAKKYQRDRASAYPSWQDQMDMLYHKGVAGWKAEIKKVKDANPKPSE